MDVIEQEQAFGKDAGQMQDKTRDDKGS